jgi:sugar phosphate isomerase/epimerase
MGVLNDIPYKSDPRTDEWVSRSVDVAQKMGAKVVLLAFFVQGDLRDDKKGTDAVVEKLKKVAPKAEKTGITFGLETWLTAEQQIEIIDRIGSKAVRIYYDVGNAQRRGYDVYKEITRLGREYICEVHAKDYDNLYGKGSVDFTKVRLAIDAISYRGWIIIEGFKTPLGLEESYRYDTEYLRKIFPPTL